MCSLYVVAESDQVLARLPVSSVEGHPLDGLGSVQTLDQYSVSPNKIVAQAYTQLLTCGCRLWKFFTEYQKLEHRD